MPEMNARDFAGILNIPIEELKQFFDSAGVQLESEEAPVDEEQKSRLLLHLRASRGNLCADLEPRRISLKRKTLGEIKVPIPTQIRGKVRYRNVAVEVRRTRTYVRRDVLEQEEEEAQAKAAQRALEEQEAKQREEEQAAHAAQTAAEASLAAEASPATEASLASIFVSDSGADQQKATVAADAAPASTAPASAAPASTTFDPAPASTADESAEEVSAAEPEVPAPAPVSAAEKESPPETEASPEPSSGQAPAAAEAPPASSVNLGFGKKKLGVDVGKARRRTRKRRLQSNVITAAGERQHTFQKPTAPVVHEVEIPENLTVGELASRMSVKAQEVIKLLMNLGTLVTINQVLDQEMAVLVVEEMGHKPRLRAASSVEQQLGELTEEQQGDLQPRPPVVTVMGHVDHGKTSLLDHLRRTRVAVGEAGGITQHIGAYQVKTPHGPMTFLDTPGHEAFSTLRARGAGVTDIVVLIVAADDGVMPQTREAVQHARAAKVPIVVAINKIDKPGADLERVRRSLAELELTPEEWGGDTMCLPMSAKTGEGVEALLEALHLQTELLELRAPMGGPARGVILEASVDRSQGPVCTVLVRGGCLRRGDVLLAGHCYGRLRLLRDEHGKSVEEAGPATPIQVLGLNNVPRAGDNCLVFQDEKKARELAAARGEESREAKLALRRPRSTDNLLERMGKAGAPVGAVLNLLLRADVHGSVEALSEAVTRLSREGKVRVELIAGSVGAITESDIDLARTFNARVIGFNVRAAASARRLAEEEGVDIHYYSIIYEAIEDMEKIVEGLVEPEIREQMVGVAEVRDVFRSSRLGAIAGCIVVEGEVRRKLPIRVLRDNVVIYEGQLESLRRFKDDVETVTAGTECGIGVKDYQDIQSGDRIENFERITERRPT